MAKPLNRFLWKHNFNFMHRRAVRRLFRKNRTLPCWCV